MADHLTTNQGQSDRLRCSHQFQAGYDRPDGCKGTANITDPIAARIRRRSLGPDVSLVVIRTKVELRKSQAGSPFYGEFASIYR
jgi:hypothetical protein